MNSFERVGLALKIKEPDRVPIITFTDIRNDNISAGLTDYIIKNVDAEFDFYADEFSYLAFPGIGIKFRKRVNEYPDGLFEYKYVTVDGKEFNEVYKYSEKGFYRTYKKHMISDPLDIYSILSIPYICPEKNDDFKKQMDNFCKDAKKHTNDNEFCTFMINNPLSFLCANTDSQDISIWTITERKLIMEYLDEITRRELEYLKYALERYDFMAVFLIGGAEFAIPPLMSPRDFDDFVLKYDSMLIQLIHKYNKQVIVHCHGRINSFINRFIQMGADGIHPLEPVGSTGDCDLKDIKDKYGNEICLIGNIQYEFFANYTPEDMKNHVKQVLDIGKNGGGFILSPACSFYQKHMPEKMEENIKEYIDAGLEYGKYPVISHRE